MSLPLGARGVHAVHLVLLPGWSLRLPGPAVRECQVSEQPGKIKKKEGLHREASKMESL